MAALSIGLIGAGFIGRAHLKGAAGAAGAAIVAIADPNPATRGLAEEFAVPWFADHHEMLARVRPEAAIVATPNALHVAVALDCLAAGAAVLVEKPIADTVPEATRLCEAAERAGLPLLVGHHRRYNPIIRRARAAIADGTLGRMVGANVTATLLKPDAYFDAAWRREKGGGPVLINLIHEIDLLRFLLGEIASLQAVTSAATRGFAVEDTAGVVLHFASGAVGTVLLSDTAASPFSWDLASGENPAFFCPPARTHLLCGTEASLTLPELALWRYPGARGWDQPIAAERLTVDAIDPYAEQLRHFAAVIRGTEAPVISGRDGTRTLAATLAVKDAAALGAAVALG